MKERLTGAIILVVLIVLLVPELLSGPSRPAPASQVAAPSSSSEDPPLRSYTIDLADETHGATPSAGTTTNAPPQASGPAQPSTIVEHPAAPQDAATAQPPPAAGPSTEESPQEMPQPAQTTSPVVLSPKDLTRPVPATAAHQPRAPAE